MRKNGIYNATESKAYFKTTSMSNFYYGRKSNGNLLDSVDSEESPNAGHFPSSKSID